VTCGSDHALPDYAQALARALSVAMPIEANERIALAHASRRVLASAIIADRDVPPFNRAQMDGYAIRAAELGQQTRWKVAHTIAAGHSAEVRVPPGQCVKIATGAPAPDDVDTVIPHEMSDRGDPVGFTIDSIERGHAVHARGADAKRGDVLIGPGTALAAHHLAIAATVGLTDVDVRRRPRAIVLSSGDEVRPVGASVLPHQIRNSNGVQTMELLSRFGAEPLENRHVPDEQGPTDDAVGQALAEADLVVTIGGISAGERDCFAGAFERLGVELALRGAAIQPGRPIVVGRTADAKVIVALPGNPVSSLACACLFIWPMVRNMLGMHDALPWRGVMLGEAVKPNSQRRAFRPAALREADNTVVVPKWAGSGDLCHTAMTHGLVELPVQQERVEAGTLLRFLPWP
jgi:molybdopterin molybdotransferase